MMAKLTQEMNERPATRQCLYAAVSKDGLANNSPKPSTRMFYNENRLFDEGVRKDTYQNIVDGSPDSVAVMKREAMDGNRFMSVPEMITAGAICERSAIISKKAGKSEPTELMVFLYRPPSFVRRPRQFTQF